MHRGPFGQLQRGLQSNRKMARDNTLFGGVQGAERENRECHRQPNLQIVSCTLPQLALVNMPPGKNRKPWDSKLILFKVSDSLQQ